MKKYRCIDNQNSKDLLTLGKIYEGNNDGDYINIEKDDVGEQRWWSSTRFKVVEQEEKRKIIGYKAPFDINGFILKGAMFIIDSYNVNYRAKGQNGSEMYLTPKIVETWEPVYEERKEEIRMEVGTPKTAIIIHRDGRIAVPGMINSATIGDLKNLLSFKQIVSNFPFSPTEWWVGCSEGTSIERGEVENIINTYNKEFKS